MVRLRIITGLLVLMALLGAGPHAQAENLLEDGSLDLGQCGTVALTGLDTYHQPAPVKRMAYAKPGLPPREIPLTALAAAEILDAS